MSDFNRLVRRHRSEFETARGQELAAAEVLTARCLEHSRAVLDWEPVARVNELSREIMLAAQELNRLSNVRDCAERALEGLLQTMSD